MNKKDKYINKTFINFYSTIQKMGLRRIKSIMYYIDRVLCLFIKKPRYEVNNKLRVIVIFNLALGDGVVFLNALKELRKIYPESNYELTLVCQKGLEKIYEPATVFDYIIPLDFTKSTVNLKERFKTIKCLRSIYYDLLLDPVGANECFTNVLMSRNALAKEKNGCLIDEYDKVCPKHILKKTYRQLKSLKTKTLIEQYYEFFYDKYTVKFYDLPSTPLDIKLPKDYYLVFPSASTTLKQYPTNRYAEIVKRIYDKTKLPLVLCGTEVDRQAYQELLKLIPDVKVIDIIGKSSLLSFIDVIKHAKFVITNDTSTYHIALISGTPVAIIVGGYTYDRYVAYEFNGCNKYKRPYIIVNKMPCFNCLNNCSKITKNDKQWPCLSSIKTSYAWQIIETMIDKEM